MKIKVEHIAGTTQYLFIFDSEGRIWKRAVNGKAWQFDGELPDEPKAASRPS